MNDVHMDSQQKQMMIAKSQIDNAGKDQRPSSPTSNKEKVIEVDENCAAIEQVESYSEKLIEEQGNMQ
jgi:hypothetical protein